MLNFPRINHDRVPSKAYSSPAKVHIVAIDGEAKPVVAQYNPTEITIDKRVPWNKHKNPKGNVPMLEFTNAESRVLSMDLFFDGLEGECDVRGAVDALMGLTLIDVKAKSDSERHPPRVLVVFGLGESFRGVIESIKVSYSMFHPDGVPARATCSLSVKEVDAVQAKSG